MRHTAFTSENPIVCGALLDGQQLAMLQASGAAPVASEHLCEVLDPPITPMSATSAEAIPNRAHGSAQFKHPHAHG